MAAEAPEAGMLASPPHEFMGGRYFEQLCFVQDEFDLLENGDVVDKRVWTGEAERPAPSDCAND